MTFLLIVIFTRILFNKFGKNFVRRKSKNIKKEQYGEYFVKPLKDRFFLCKKCDRLFNFKKILQHKIKCNLTKNEKKYTMETQALAVEIRQRF